MKFSHSLSVLLLLTLFMALLSIAFGPGGIVGQMDGELLKTLIWQIRFPRVIVAFFSGGSLGLVALLLQTYFQNPLAGPFVLGIHSGAALGVALAIFLAPILPFGILLTPLPMAFIGAMVVCFMLLLLMQRYFSKILLLVVGLVFGYFISGIINILVNLSSAVQIKNFVLWNLGSFDRIHGEWLVIYALSISLISVILWFWSSSFNALMLGENYALSLGVKIRQVRWAVLLGASVLTALVISFCGPIAFIGIISPHLLRKMVAFNDHRKLFPLVFILGGDIALLASFLSSALSFQLPLNAILGLLGAPILFFIIYQQSRGGVR
jgi:iron complex transport system permease protein